MAQEGEKNKKEKRIKEKKNTAKNCESKHEVLTSF